MTIADDKEEDGFFVHNAHHRCASLNDEMKSDNGSKMINLLIVPQARQTHEKKNYKCKKANHGAEIISKKRFKKSDDNLVVKIKQVQTHHFGENKDCKNARTDNATKMF